MINLTENVKELLLKGDALIELKKLEDNSIDSVVTDPPYGLSKEPNIEEVLTKWLAGEPYDHGHGGFMGKEWDSFVPHPDIWKEVFRVLKPGGHALVFAGTRTQDLMTIALRLAGFEVRDVIEWLYFTGFPKSYNISKAFDRRAGAKREVIGYGKLNPKDKSVYIPNANKSWFMGDKNTSLQGREITAPATDLAKQWEGWGTALKPAHEPIIMVRKPLRVGGQKATIIDNVKEHGTGGINIDDCKIGDGADRASGGERKAYMAEGSTTFNLPMDGKRPTGGRHPANCITLDDDQFYSKFFNITPKELSKKASKKDRNSDWQGNEIVLEERVAGGLRGRADGSLGSVTYNRNIHPTVKPTDLMAWLVRLVTPPNGTVLDPFAGSGSTLVAAKREGFGYVGGRITR